MYKLASIVLPVILTFVFVDEVSSIVCTKEEIFGDTRPLICPGPNESKDKVYCCGPKKLRYCCSYADYASAINTIGIIVGVLVTAIVVVVVVVVVSCFCCSCCLLAKRRNRRDHSYTTGQPATTTTTATGHYPAQATTYPIQTFPTSYPQQYQQQFPQQQFTQEHFQHQYPPNPYPPQAPYAPPGGYQTGYPPVGNPPPYPMNDQPPYNPSFPPAQ